METYEIVDGQRVAVRIRDSDGCWISVDKLTAAEQVARNQYFRRLRRARRDYVAAQRAAELEGEGDNGRDD